MRSRGIPLTLSFLTLSTVLMGQTVPTPPSAKQVEHISVWHEEKVHDPYFWLREKSNPAVLRYLEAENAYTEAMTRDLQPFVESLYQEMLGRIKQTDLTVPTRRGGYFYYSRTEKGKQYPIQCRKKATANGALDEQAAEEVLLDLNELARGFKFLSLGAFAVSDDAHLLAYTTATTGFRQYQLSIKDLRTGAILPDRAERVTSVDWCADNRTLFYVTEDPLTKRSNLLWRHVLGEETEPVYQENDRLYTLRLGRSKDRKMLFLRSASTDTWETRFLPSDQPNAPFKVLLTRKKGHKYDVEHREGLFYIRSNDRAKNFRLVTAPVADPSAPNWKEFIPARADVLLDHVELFKDYVVAAEKSAALEHFRIYDFRSGQWHEMTFPESAYAASPIPTPEYTASKFRFAYQSLITPRSVYAYDMGTRQQMLLKREEVLGGYDPAQYVTERQWASARDGVKIPLSIAYRKGLPRNGSAPLFLYGYGSYGSGVPASFSSPRLSLLDRGMVFVIAHIRGGNEMGETWHDDGMLLKKKNTFFDFVDSAEWLIANGWTRKDRLVIEGGSAGGLLMGAVVNLRPDLFAAVHMAVPFVDVMNTMMDASLPLTVGEYLEWGNPNEKPAFDYIRSYSPYDNLARRAYPAILVTTSLNDSQVMYWEPTKYVAKLRTLKTDANPLLLKCNMGAGHGGSSGRYDRLKETAFQYAWLMHQVGISKDMSAQK
ncbi:MAG TPA: S9 family peptidase [Gemmataceae bacterium]|nr:S9 family peptidase [Gemmataceae bacterium]